MKNKIILYRRNERAEHKYICVADEIVVKPEKNILMNVELRKLVGVAKIAPTTQRYVIPTPFRRGFEHLISRRPSIVCQNSIGQHSKLGLS